VCVCVCVCVCERERERERERNERESTRDRGRERREGVFECESECVCAWCDTNNGSGWGQEGGLALVWQVTQDSYSLLSSQHDRSLRQSRLCRASGNAPALMGEFCLFLPEG
jgi:hypothetical protein